MVEQSNTELTDEEKAALVEQEKQAGTWQYWVCYDTGSPTFGLVFNWPKRRRKAREDEIRRMPSMSNEQFKRFTPDNWGF